MGVDLKEHYVNVDFWKSVQLLCEQFTLLCFKVWFSKFGVSRTQLCLWFILPSFS